MKGNSAAPRSPASFLLSLLWDLRVIWLSFSVSSWSRFYSSLTWTIIFPALKLIYFSVHLPSQCLTFYFICFKNIIAF